MRGSFGPSRTCGSEARPCVQRHQEQWTTAEIYATTANAQLAISAHQAEQLSLFAP